jgi:type 1 glutamine amidotransferase
MLAAIRAGTGFVGIHAATDSHVGNLRDEDGVDMYTRLVGARFTGHGPQQTATLTVVQPTEFSSLKERGEQITIRDEWYGMGQFNRDMHVLIIQETEGMDGNDYARPPYPMTWIRMEGEGRVAYTSLGHDNRYLLQVVEIVADIVEWSVGRFNVDTTPNIEQATPGFATMP